MPSGKSKTQTATESTAPPAYVDQQLRYGVQEARNLYDKGAPAFFQGQTYAGFTPQQENALALTEQRATRGSPITREAGNQLQRTLSGEYLNANPYIDGQIDAATRGITQRFGEIVIPNVQSSLSRNGRYGNNASTQQLFTNAQRTLAQQLSDTEAGIRGQNYQTERGLQNQAIYQAPSFAANDYADLGKLAMVGEQRQAMNQQGIDEAMQRYQYDNNIDQVQLDQFLARITGVSPQAGQTGTKTTPVQGSNTFGQLLGLGATIGGAALGSPWLGTYVNGGVTGGAK